MIKKIGGFFDEILYIFINIVSFSIILHVGYYTYYT